MNIIPLYLYSNDYVSFIKSEPFPNSFRFYVLNTKTFPYPGFTNLFCIKEENDGSILDISTIYDPYNKTVSCNLKFLAWLRKVQHTIPLYLYKGSKGIIIKPKQVENFTPHKIPVIYVLGEKVENIDFTFENDDGKILPDPDSKLGITQAMAIKTSKENDETFSSELRTRREKTTENMILIFILALLVILIIVI